MAESFWKGEWVIEEAHFYEDDDGLRHDFDANEWEKDITIFEVPIVDVEAFRCRGSSRRSFGTSGRPKA
ncbi:MAG: hypothetical protein CVU63_14175 [Deltaproteobacteria bacterium HGW-Deltaproteobacteria-20]|jgi:hypothetical protein|nr:MAG: hypothetical protein CVU63_14175 [Deltaproteobacteria bacterium HGW-Deltaproteobacteria-20]